MPMTGFDTLEYVHQLKEAGVPEKQAETHAHALSEVIESNLATKRDIESVRRDIKLEIETVHRDIKELELKFNARLEKTKSDMTVEIEKLKSDVIKWSVGAVFTAVGLFATIIKLLG